MRVGVYVDGYNSYYGGRSSCGRSTPGWRWLDIRGLVADVVRIQGSWKQVQLQRLVYCTARVDASINASAHADQDVYLKALVASGSVDWIEYGNYVAPREASVARDARPRYPAISGPYVWLAGRGPGRDRRSGP